MHTLGGCRPGKVGLTVSVAATLTLSLAASSGAAGKPAAVPHSAASALAYWPLDDVAGTTARERVAGRDGNRVGPVSVAQVAQGPTETSYRFSGAGSLVAAPAAGLVPATRAVSAWIRLPRPPLPAGGSVIDLGSIAVAVSHRWVSFATCAPDAPCATFRLPARLGDGAWHQIAASVSASGVTAYVDGNLAGAGPGTPASRPPADGEVAIGRAFDGNIDRVTLWSAPLTADVVRADFTAGACPQATAPSSTPAPAAVARRPQLPLHTHGRFVVDATGKRVKFAGVNWYGAEQLDHVPAGLQCQRADMIAARIAASGFNVVRLPWATTTWLGPDKRVPPVAVAADPSLWGLTARQVFDAVVAALARRGLLVILDNHVTTPRWCCSEGDGNALWWQGYDPANPPAWQRLTHMQRMHRFHAGERRWLQAWRRIAGRYARGGAHPQPMVVGADLRNEPRPDDRLGIAARWSHPTAPWTDWPRAARRGGDVVLAANPRLLVAVEGLPFASDLRGVARRPIRLAKPHRLIYSAHDYSWTQPTGSAAALRRTLRRRWGWLLRQHQRYTAPVWVGEFGTCHPEVCGDAEASWFKAFTRYLADADVDWTYWSFNGTGGRGEAEPTTCTVTLRFPGCGESYGLSDASWSGDASPSVTAALRSITDASQGP